jgi:sulfite exporter TauE/SafE
MVLNGLIFGLISTLHCAGMCGPLAMMIPSKVNSGKWNFAIAYQIGRISMYIGVGLVVYAIGVSFSVFRLQQGLSLVVGAFMVVYALMALFKIRAPQLVDKPYKKLVGKFGQILSSGKAGSALALGAINGLLPCGAIYIAALYCATFTQLTDAIAYMALFGLGTMPVFIAAWLFMSKKFSLKLRSLHVIYKVLPLIVGVLMVLRGLDLGIPYISPELSQQENKTQVGNCCKH